ncbi:YkvA family protein [Bacillus sp. 2205SS5-2]|uniref:YkvA family protein n=1 Tax=Bacillus sp. 2205SS5-2 TaxID=3109031 RepID=UPI0030042AD9
MENDLENVEIQYSEKKFWTKLKKYSKKAGSSAVYAALLLYFTLQKPEVPKKVKATIIAALGYFILPTDLIPDLMIGIGYTDDLGALSIALVQVAFYMDEEVKRQAREKIEEWFGKDVDTSEVDEKIGY